MLQKYKESYGTNALGGVQADVFNKFKDNEGKFNPSLANDVRGLLSLYEAAQLRVHGEVILDDALVFITTHLESKASHLSSPLSDQVSHALKHPIRKSLQRREARLFLSINHQDASYSEVLLTFAKLDYNQLQKLYQKELADLTRLVVIVILLMALILKHRLL